MIGIKYIFAFDEASRVEFDLRFEEETMRLVGNPESAAAWTNLEFHQCPHCPLRRNESPQCPAALHLHDPVRRLGKVTSYETVNLHVITKEREIRHATTAHNAFSSFIGLIMASSGCPYTAYLRPMARFHLPLASLDETLYRAASMYLLAQYFRSRQGDEFDASLSGLTRIYGDLKLVNATMAERLRASGEIRETNAIAILDLYAQTLPLAIEEGIEELHNLFRPYLT